MKLATVHHPLFLTLSLAARAFAFRSSPSFLLVRRSGKCFQQTNEEEDTITSISTWTDADDWSKLSSANHLLDGSDIYDQDLVGNAARRLEMTVQGVAVSPDDEWISSMVDQIHDEFLSLDDDTPLYDTSFDEPQMNEQLGDMSNEIAMLIRCNERPQDLLISEGRALPPLSEHEKKNVYQLVSIDGESVQATNFLKESVSIIFRHHAIKDDDDDALYLDRTGVAKWMSQALKTEETRVSAHDARVLRTISDFSSYGSGRLVESNFQDLYLTAVVGPIEQNRKTSWKRHLQLRQPHVDAVWRDLRNHGILSPIERERSVLVEKLNASSSTIVVPTADTIMDECEILDWDYSERKKVGTNPGDRKTASGTMSSHKILEMAPATKTPLWMRDGELIFIDEESCIGCMQCVNVSPDSFFMLENGRARTFQQRCTSDVKQAVASCPVACMHSVTYTELEEYETARDEGDGRDDHRHLGHQRGHIPLHVAGMDSDVNRRSSWYHTLKERCLTSGQCPQKGCYDCPRFAKPGENPFFQQRQKEMDHVRADYFLEHVDLSVPRKTADL